VTAITPPRTLQVKAKPNAREDALVLGDDGVWIASIKAPPVDGKANEALIALVAQHFGVRRAQVTIKRGTAARLKTVEIAD
jgi:uncharacterized protein